MVVSDTQLLVIRDTFRFESLVWAQPSCWGYTGDTAKRTRY